MSDGDDETADGDDAAEEAGELSAGDVEERLDEAAEALDSAETEADLDDVEADLDEAEETLEAADLPEPDEGDEEDEEGPRAELESRLEDLRSDLEEARGPYAEDVVAEIETAKSTVEDTRWTAAGESGVVDAVTAFADTVAETLEDADELAPESDDEAALLDALDDSAAAVGDADLDPDDDTETIDTLLEATGTLSDGLEAAEEWDDLQVHEQLAAEGFYDVLGHYKDFPPEWSAIKVHEEEGNVEMILRALEMFDSDFMEEHCLEALTRMNDQRAQEAMMQRASRRDKPGIKALGKMAAEDAVDTLVEYVDTDSDPGLQKVTLRALGEIGSEEATQAVADKLVMDNENVRPHVARTLGLIGDTRAVDPLADTLENDEDDNVRAAAAWALRQIGTEAALEAAADHVDDRSYLVQYEAERAADSLGLATA
jgi:ElaB/YqjD/DUF883 family membrane-anchored ribosome-binding protein